MFSRMRIITNTNFLMLPFPSSGLLTTDTKWRSTMASLRT